MRIACVYLPSFPLQAHVRQAPHLGGASLAVADAAAKGSVVMACSRAAWAEGIRSGMAVATARIIAPELRVVVSDPALYDHALAAVTDTLLGLCDTVEVGPAAEGGFTTHRAVYVSVPPRTRGAAFGQKLLAQLARQGFRGRVGVADDRFTAHVAAVTVDSRGRAARLDATDGKPPLFHQSCTSVPRGGSAAFLAPLPLSYLPIDPDVQRMLHTCGVKTLGDFAALPPPSVSRPWLDVDFQALARGHGPATVRGVRRDGALGRRVVERVDLPGSERAEEPLWLALRTLCDRACLRLDGRDRAATAVRLRLVGPASQTTEVSARRTRPTSSSRDVLDMLGQELAHLGVLPPARAAELEIVAEAEPVAAALELFAAEAPRARTQYAAPRAAQHAAQAGLTHAAGEQAVVALGASLPSVTAAPAPRTAHRRPHHAHRRPRCRAVQQHLFER